MWGRADGEHRASVDQRLGRGVETAAARDDHVRQHVKHQAAVLAQSDDVQWSQLARHAAASRAAATVLPLHRTDTHRRLYSGRP